MQLWSTFVLLQAASQLGSNALEGVPKLSDTVRYTDHHAELYAFYDAEAQTELGGTKEKAELEVIEIVQHTTALMYRLNIRLHLLGVEKFTSSRKFNTTNDLLNAFGEYLATIVKDKPADMYTLFTGGTFNAAGDENTLGRAIKGTICDLHKASSVILIRKHRGRTSTRSEAATLSHELGHTLGFSHSDDVKKCGNENLCDAPDGISCIMKASSIGHQAAKWSQCSYDKMAQGISIRLYECLRRVPTHSADLNTFCGNGVVEGDEACDCGGEVLCAAYNNTCCEPKACTLKSGMACGSGDCCDLATCTIRPSASVCRPSLRECDLPEMCDGSSARCPVDFHIRNGEACAGGAAFCYSGHCYTRDEQCRDIIGPDASSPDACHFCRRIGRIDLASCQERCGPLFCHAPHGMNTSTYTMKGASYNTFDNNCYRISMPFSQTDFGQVHNGTVCAADKWCWRGRCTSVAETADKTANCGKGVADNTGACFCHGCEDPASDCVSFGHGGSVLGGPGSAQCSQKLQKVMLGIFIPLIVLIIGLIIVGVVFRRRLTEWISYSKQVVPPHHGSVPVCIREMKRPKWAPTLSRQQPALPPRDFSRQNGRSEASQKLLESQPTPENKFSSAGLKPVLPSRTPSKLEKSSIGQPQDFQDVGRKTAFQEARTNLRSAGGSAGGRRTPASPSAIHPATTAWTPPPAPPTRVPGQSTPQPIWPPATTKTVGNNPPSGSVNPWYK